MVLPTFLLVSVALLCPTYKQKEYFFAEQDVAYGEQLGFGEYQERASFSSPRYFCRVPNISSSSLQMGFEILLVTNVCCHDTTELQ